MNEDYLGHLVALDKKLKFVQSNQMARLAFASRDLLPAIEKLRVKALVKVRPAPPLNCTLFCCTLHQ